MIILHQWSTDVKAVCKSKLKKFICFGLISIEKRMNFGFIYIKVGSSDRNKENVVIKDVNRRNCLSWCCEKRGPTVEIYMK